METPEPNNAQPGSVEAFNINDWKLDDKDAKKMMDHRRNPGNDMSNIVDYNDDIRKAIDAAFPSGKKTWVEARYKDKDDESRYCRLRKIPDEGENRGRSGRVKDYKTKIYRVEDDSKEIAEVHYFDIAVIKPPPPED